MPMIMEDHSAYNMDDLFGDSEPVNLYSGEHMLSTDRRQAIPQQPPVKGLAQRLDELHENGCCQKIAWSKNGCVAYIAPDGRSVHLKVFYRDECTGKWDLGQDIPLELPPASDDFPYVHIMWGFLGSELAVVDAAGRIFIFGSTSCLGRMVLTRAQVNEQEDEMAAVVGMHWLAVIPHQHKNYICYSADFQSGEWRFHASSHTFNDLHHPLEGRAALVCVSKNGLLRLRFQQPDGTWQESSVELEYMSSAREPFTHAAFASNNDSTLILAAHDIDGRLHVYRVSASWTVPPPNKGAPQKNIPPPTLEATNLFVEDRFYPLSSMALSGALNSSIEQKVQLPAQLTHLYFLPATPKQLEDGTLPTIHAIFSQPPNVMSLDHTQPQQAQYSVLTRWEFHQNHHNILHPSLDQVASKKKNVGTIQSRLTYRLKRQADTHLHSLVLSFCPLWFNMLLAFSYSDGTTEFRDRATLALIQPDYSTDKVTCLPQAGFGFGPLNPSLHVALSANHCMAVTMQSDGSIKLQTMLYNHGALHLDEEDAKHGAALAALVLQSYTAANQYYSNDDVFAVMGEISEKRKHDFINLLFRALNLNLDPAGPDDVNGNSLLMLGRSPNFAKGLSAVNILGIEPSGSSGSTLVRRSISGKIAWAIINLKYVSQVLTTIMRMHGNIDKTALQPQIAPSMIGITRWMIHFMTYVLDELITLGTSLQDTPNFSRATLEAKIKEQGTPALALMLSAFPRTMVKMWHHPFQWMQKTAMMYASNSPSPEIRRMYYRLQQSFMDAAFDWRHFEQLVQETNHVIRLSYQKEKYTELQKGNVERQLMMGEIPEIFLPAARRLLIPCLFDETNGLLEKGSVDQAKVMFFDTTWLGMSNSKHATDWHKANIVDVCQKQVVRGPVTNSDIQGRAGLGRKGLRRCTRCCAFMEDVSQGTPGYSNSHFQWLQNVAKHCVCGNFWMMVEEGG